MVRLKDLNSFPVSAVTSDFNSTMVRLKVEAGMNPYLQDVFQFHYGTIKSRMNSRLSKQIRYFNSTMVRLKGKRLRM